MAQFTDRPIPLIDPRLCDGCGLCVRACPTQALAVQDGKAVVASPLACEYSGLCEAVCPAQAITRPFKIVWNVPKVSSNVRGYFPYHMRENNLSLMNNW
ncbi:MAG: 4Fe-4S binding protein [Chloroflexota bacterium]